MDYNRLKRGNKKYNTHSDRLILLAGQGFRPIVVDKRCSRGMWMIYVSMSESMHCHANKLLEMVYDSSFV